MPIVIGKGKRHFDPAKHPRVMSGKDGGQFARKGALQEMTSDDEIRRGKEMVARKTGMIERDVDNELAALWVKGLITEKELMDRVSQISGYWTPTRYDKAQRVDRFYRSLRRLDEHGFISEYANMFSIIDKSTLKGLSKQDMAKSMLRIRFGENDTNIWQQWVTEGRPDRIRSQEQLDEMLKFGK